MKDLEYTIADLKSAFKFSKENPKSKFGDWVKVNNKTLTKEEKKLFANMEIATIPVPQKKGKDNHLYVINWIGVGGGHHIRPFNVFLRKHFGAYYKFYIDSGRYIEMTLVTPDNSLFDSDNFVPNKDFNNVIEQEIVIGDVEVLIMNHMDLDCDEDEVVFDNFQRWKSSLEKDNYFFWTDGYWCVFVSDPYKLKFEPVLSLFKS